MQNQGNNLSERFLDFAANTVKLTIRLGKTAAGRHLAGQLLRSGTSAGANYEEACGAESRADFIHKMQIALKELKESLYWLRLTQKASLLHPTDPNLTALLQEATELANIVAMSIITARKPR